MPLITVNPQQANTGKQVNQLSNDMQLQTPVKFEQNTEGVRNYTAPLPTPQPVQKNIDQMYQQGLERIQQSNDPITQTPKNQSIGITQDPISQNLELKTQNTVPTPSVATMEANIEQAAAKVEANELSLDSLLTQGINQGASDVHLSVGYRAYLRVNGELVQLSTPILTPENIHTFAKQLTLSRKDINIDDMFQADLSYAFGGMRFRVNIFKKSGVLSIVLRLIPSDIKSIEQLGLPPIFYDFAKIGGGLILVTGPTGSGKSTTIASLINYINFNMKRHIVTVEDPIEFVYPKAQSIINQREYGIDFDSWPNALKAILRQDPDIVLVGEMRDYETIASAITISETGHLVFATLHTNSAAQSIDRIIDVFPEGQQPQIRAQLANTITAIVSQRLAPLTLGGRKAVLEVMVANPAIKNSIREGKIYQIDNMIQTGQDAGMISMEQSLVNLVKEGKITVETAQSISVKPRELEILLNK